LLVEAVPHLPHCLLKVDHADRASPCAICLVVNPLLVCAWVQEPSVRRSVSFHPFHASLSDAIRCLSHLDLLSFFADSTPTEYLSSSFMSVQPLDVCFRFDVSDLMSPFNHWDPVALYFSRLYSVPEVAFALSSSSATRIEH